MADPLDQDFRHGHPNTPTVRLHTGLLAIWVFRELAPNGRLSLAVARAATGDRDADEKNAPGNWTESAFRSRFSLWIGVGFGLEPGANRSSSGVPGICATVGKPRWTDF